MKHKTTLFGLMALMLILSACSPVVATSPASAQPTATIGTTPTAGYQPVDVDHVEAVVGVGSPIPVQVIVSGNLPDSCAQVELMQQKQQGSHFDITLSSIPSTVEGCVQDTLPFKVFIPLNIVNLPPGSYTVAVNGSPASFDVDTGNTTSSLPTADSEISRADIEVANVNVEIGEGSPIPVHAIVGLNFTNTCAQVGEMRLHREGNIFYIRLIADIAQRDDCQADLPSGSIPFRMDIPLNIVNLPAGPYEVNVNGVTASFDPNAKPAGLTDLAEFENQLLANLTQRNGEGLRSLMDERFILAGWPSDGESLPADEAWAQILGIYASENVSIAFDEFQGLPGFDPKRLVGPDVELAKTLFVTRWGIDGKGEALFLIARRPDGSLYWHSAIEAMDGFTPAESAACSAPVEVPVMDGSVSYNGISFRLDPVLAASVFARFCQTATDGPHPPYTQFFLRTFSNRSVDFHPEIRVYDVQGDLGGYFYPNNNEMDQLQATIAQRSEPVTWFQHSPLHTRQAYLDFAGGSGVRGLVQHMQDFFFFTNNGLTYEFNGLTQDGRYYVDVRYPVSVYFLMELDGFRLPPVNLNPQAIPVTWPESFEQQKQVIEAYNAEALRRFEELSDGDVSPGLALLDGLVQSIQIGQP